MINEEDVMDKMVEVIQDHLSEFLPETYTITDGQVILDYPNVDKMAFDVCVYVAPQFSEMEPSTTCSDSIDFRLSVFILCKRDSQSNLTKKYFAYYNALYYLLRNYTTLDGFIDETKVLSVDFYPSVEANPNVRGAEISISTKFEKDF